MHKEKVFSVRLSKEMWVFLKKHSIEQEKPMNTIIFDCLEKYKNKYEKRLTNNNTAV